MNEAWLVIKCGKAKCLNYQELYRSITCDKGIKERLLKQIYISYKSWGSKIDVAKVRFLLTNRYNKHECYVIITKSDYLF
jgi:hypothetical protein